MPGSDDDVGFGMAPPRAPGSIKHGESLHVKEEELKRIKKENGRGIEEELNRIEEELRRIVEMKGVKCVFLLLVSDHTTSTKRPAYCSTLALWTPPFSTQALPTDTISTRVAVARNTQPVSGTAPRSIPSPETLRYRKTITSTPFLPGCKSPFIFIGFSLSECVSECVGACLSSKPVEDLLLLLL